MKEATLEDVEEEYKDDEFEELSHVSDTKDQMGHSHSGLPPLGGGQKIAKNHPNSDSISQS